MSPLPFLRQLLPMMILPRNLILALLAANLWLTGCDRNRQEKAPSEEAAVVNLFPHDSNAVVHEA